MNPEQLCPALNAISEAICLCDKEGRVLFMNSAARSLTGWQEGCCFIDMSKNAGRMEIGGRSFLCTLHPLQDDRDSAFLALLKCSEEDCAGNDVGRWDRFLAGAALATKGCPRRPVTFWRWGRP